MIRKVGDQHKLIVVIVKKGLSGRIIKACKKAGAEGATILQGRGTGSHDYGTILGIKIESDKEIILCLIEDPLVDKAMSKINAAARLDRHGTGIAFVLNSKSITGIAHLLEEGANH